jgi:hypothetical protein
MISGLQYIFFLIIMLSRIPTFRARILASSCSMVRPATLPIARACPLYRSFAAAAKAPEEPSEENLPPLESLTFQQKLQEAWKQSRPRIITIGLLCGGAVVLLMGASGVWCGPILHPLLLVDILTL